jgi:GNAT superfamily N-acetyltransferase
MTVQDELVTLLDRRLDRRSLVHIKRVIEGRLEDWPLTYDGELYFHEFKPTFFAVQFQDPPCWQVRSRNHFSVNIINDVFYLLQIELEQEKRGKGLGAMLYQCLELAAKDLHCDRLEMTGSGWTNSGESRCSYLARHGYTVNGCVAVKPWSKLGEGWGDGP